MAMGQRERFERNGFVLDRRGFSGTGRLDGVWVIGQICDGARKE